MADDAAFIRKLQNLLNKHGYALKVDGSFGPKTKAAVTDFQTRTGLPVNGLASRQTMNRLFSLPPMPRRRPNVDVLGTGKTGMPKPTLRPDMSPPSEAPLAPTEPQTKEWSPGAYQRDLAETRQMNPQANLNPAFSGIHPGTMFDMTYGRTLTAADEAKRLGQPYGGVGARPPPADVPSLPEFGAGLTPPTVAPQLSQMAGPPQQTPPPAPQKPGFTPTPMNQGIGLPGQPPAADFPSLIGDAFGNIGGFVQNLMGGDKPQTAKYGGANPVDSNKKVNDALTVAINRDVAKRQLAQQMALQQMNQYGMVTGTHPAQGDVRTMDATRDAQMQKLMEIIFGAMAGPQSPQPEPPPLTSGPRDNPYL